MDIDACCNVFCRAGLWLAGKRHSGDMRLACDDELKFRKAVTVHPDCMFDTVSLILHGAVEHWLLSQPDCSIQKLPKHVHVLVPVAMCADNMNHALKLVRRLRILSL